MAYRVLTEQSYAEGLYRLVPLREQDIMQIMEWRNDQIDILRQNKALTPEDQQQYFENVIKPSFREERPKIILFSFLLGDRCIGYGGLTNIDWPSKRAELSFLLDTGRLKDEKTYRQDFTNFLALIKKVLFNDLKFNRFFTETFDIRPLHISVLEAAGMRREGRMEEHTFIKNKFVDSVIHGYLRKDYVQK
jgi:RimJ/RimL family protein N-acetyltransferase